MALVFGSGPIEVGPRFVLGRESVPCVAEVVDGSLRADCAGFVYDSVLKIFLRMRFLSYF